MRESKVTGKKREFKANGSHIREAFEWLIKNCPDFKEIQIDEDTLAQSPLEGGKIDLQQLDDIEESEKKKRQQMPRRICTRG